MEAAGEEQVLPIRRSTQEHSDALGSTRKHSEGALRSTRKHSEALGSTQKEHSGALRRTRKHSEALRRSTQKHPEALGSTQKPPDATRRHKKPPEATSSYQKPSEAISHLPVEGACEVAELEATEEHLILWEIVGERERSSKIVGERGRAWDWEAMEGDGRFEPQKSTAKMRP